MSGLLLSINNGASTRNTVVQVSADIGVDAGAEVRIGYSIGLGYPPAVWIECSAEPKR